MKIEDLKQLVQSAAALRYRARLQPAGGPGDKVFPPTYEKGTYAEEKRRIDGHTVDCVHLDSVQSQANRMEEALLEAAREGTITLPRVDVDFRAKAEQLLKDAKSEEEKASLEDLKKVGVISSLDAPHRLADAILRDSYLDGKRYPESENAQKWICSTIVNATGLFEEGPTSLLFGTWFNPTGGAGNKGNRGTKFPRCIVSDLVAVNVVIGTKVALRIDPLGIEKDAGTLYYVSEETGEWSLNSKTLDGKARKKVGDKGAPSEVVHGNILTSMSTGGVTFDYALQTTVISLPALRRLQFPVDCKPSKDIDLIAQTVLAALGLAAATLSISKGINLRSRCDLVPEPGQAKWELVLADGTTQDFTISSEDACKLLNDAVVEAVKVGLTWRKEPLVLLPSDGLAELVRRSRQLTSQAKSEG